MAIWLPLRRELEEVEERRTYSWNELDALVGGLPKSAYVHAGFWKGDRPAWAGFTTTDVIVGMAVTFVRRGAAAPERKIPERKTSRSPVSQATTRADIILVGCVKSKLSHPASVSDLYTSALFRKARAFAEQARVPWFVLSAKHGLVEPSQVLEPYDLQMSRTSRDYTRTWGIHVLQQLQDAVGPLAGKRIEVHAGAAYVNAIRAGLVSVRAQVLVPLEGLGLGERLSWYPTEFEFEPVPVAERASEIGDIVARLGDDTRAVTPTSFLATKGEGTRLPGLYSWWVDEVGAADLTAGLGYRLCSGLIYLGLAGATRSRSGKKSSNSLWGRIHGMHLGGRHEFSTFRLSLGSILASALDETEIDEERLTSWMVDHLRLVTVTVEDPDILEGLETEILAALDPPLNIRKMAKTDTRSRLSELRRCHGGTVKPR